MTDPTTICICLRTSYTKISYILANL